MVGFLADKVFESMMLNSDIAQRLFTPIVVTGKGSGMTIIFIIIRIIGTFLSLIFKKNKHIKHLDN